MHPFLCPKSFVFNLYWQILQIWAERKVQTLQHNKCREPLLGLIHKSNAGGVCRYSPWTFCSVISRIIVCLLYRAIKWKQGRRWYNVNIIEQIFNPQATKIDHHTSLAPLILCWSKRSVIRHIKIICVVTAFPFFRSRSLKLICLLFRGKMKLSIVISRMSTKLILFIWLIYYHTFS